MLPLGAEDWQPITAMAMLAEGDGVKTGNASSATITFPDGSLARVNANAEVFLLAAPTEEDAGVSLQLVTGEVWSRLQQLAPGSSYTVSTDTALAAVRGTEFSVVADAEGTDVATYESLVAVASVEDLTELDETMDPLATPQGDVGEGEVLRIARSDLEAFAERRRAMKAAGQDFHAPLLLERRAAKMSEELRARPWLDESRAAARRTRPVLSAAERAAALQRITHPELDGALRTKIMAELRARRLRPTELPKLMPELRRDPAQFLKDPRSFLRAKLLERASTLLPSSTDTTTSTTIDWSTVGAVVGAAIKAPGDADVQRRVSNAMLTDAQRAAFLKRGVLDAWVAMQTAARARDAVALERAARAVASVVYEAR